MSASNSLVTASKNQTIKQPLTRQELLGYARELPMRERLSLVEQILAELIPQLPPETPKLQSLHSLLGLWQGFTITEDDISEARREMWGNFGDRV